MTQLHVKTSTLRGQMTIPSSKSHTLRAILFGALGKGKSIVRDPLLSTDAQAMIEACRSLGAKINSYETYLEIEGLNGHVKQAEDVIQAGNSGLVLRMISAVAALAAQPIVMTGDYSIRHQRPMRPLIEGLQQLGATVESTRGDGYAPFIIRGPLKGGKARINGEDSQPVSALLIASIFAPEPVELEVQNPGEKAWVALTLDWLQRLGIACQQQDFTLYRMPGKSCYLGFDYKVPGDWSSAAFPLAAALVTNSELTLQNLDLGDCQGDKEVLQVLQQMGAHIEVDAHNRILHISKNSQLKGIEIDANNFIDAVPILAVLACYAEGVTRIRNASIARHKECNRLRCVVQELSKMGADINEEDDGLTIRQASLKGARVFSHHDHRMAMSLAVAAMGAKGSSVIEHTDCVKKTFPTFANDFIHLGVRLEEKS